MPGERDARLRDDALLHGRRDERLRGTRDAKLGRAAQHREHVRGVARVERAGRDRRRQCERQHVQAAGGVGADGGDLAARAQLDGLTERTRA